MNDIELKNYNQETRKLIDQLSTTDGSDVKTNHHCCWDVRSNKWYHPTQELLNRQATASCISMINSLICYDYAGKNWTPEDIIKAESKRYHNFLAEYIESLGSAKVAELIKGQQDSIKSIKRNVYTDSEGVSYNSIVWN